MAQRPNLFENQTVNGTSLEVPMSAEKNNLYIEGVFDGAIIEIETTFFNLSWVKETSDGTNVIQVTAPISLEAERKAEGTKIRLNLSNAGAGTNISAGIY